MGIIQDAQVFVQRLLFPAKKQGCPDCGSPLIKKHGFFSRQVRDLDGIRTIRCQRWRCCACGRTWSDETAEVARHKWYSRRVERKFLDYHVSGFSLRTAASFITAEITGKGRTFLWDVLARLPWWGRAPEPEPEIELSHTTGWRWEQTAGEEWRKRQKPYAAVPQSGIVTSDATYVRIRGVWTAVLGAVDSVKRTLFGLYVLQDDESEEEIERAFDRAERAGLNLEGIKVFISDGGGGFREFLARCLHWVVQKRCIFHLWRNVLPLIARYATVAGEKWALGLKVCIALVWNAPSRMEAEVALRLLVAAYAAEPIAKEAVRIVQETFEEAMLHLAEGMSDVGRTSNACEWVWRYYKERVRAMVGFMSQPGCDNFSAIWSVALNFRRYQRRKERWRHYQHPGKCPLEVAGVMVQQVTWLDALAV